MTEKTKSCSRDRCGSKKGGGLFMGGAMMLFGGAFLLEQTGHLGGFSAWQLWPIVLVWGGLLRLFGQIRCGGNVTCGLVLLAVGGGILANNFGLIDLKWSVIWPALLILLGILIFIATIRTPGRRKSHKNADDLIVDSTFDSSLVMGGREDEIHSKEFENANISVIMGGLELDMRNADIKGEEATLNIRVIMGGVELWVPEHWEVMSRISPVMGGVENKVRRRVVSDESPVKRLIIDGNIVMGGVEIQN
jgi:predicted membrane protein